MKTRRFEWDEAVRTARALREWVSTTEPGRIDEDVKRIQREVLEERDDALRRLTEQFDGVEQMPDSLKVDPAEAEIALRSVEPKWREAMEVAAANIRAVAEAQLVGGVRRIDLPQGQTVLIEEVPVSSVGIYAPGGRATYPSSVLMCAIPAHVAGVESLTLVSPPRPNGRLAGSVLAAAALCGIEEIYAVGGAQAIFALTFGTETVVPVDVIAGPGNFWVQEAKRTVMGIVGIDSFAGPSELMLVAGPRTNPEWAALDLCAQAEHGPESPLVVVATDGHVLEKISAAAQNAATTRPTVAEAPLALVQVPSLDEAINLANAYAPEHLELLDEDAVRKADRVRTAGCVFLGEHGATAFGDYAAGSNHVLPTTRTGRFAGPLGPSTFRRRLSKVELDSEAAATLAPYVDVLAKAEGLPVHGESAMIRAMHGEEGKP
jgi:histidinol dehydrogenase